MDPTYYHVQLHPTPSYISSHNTASLYNISSIFYEKCFFVCAKCACFCAKCAKYFCLCAMPLCFFVFAYLGASRCVTPLQEPAAPGLCHHLEGFFHRPSAVVVFFLFCALMCLNVFAHLGATRCVYSPQEPIALGGVTT